LGVRSRGEGGSFEGEDGRGTESGGVNQADDSKTWSELLLEPFGMAVRRRRWMGSAEVIAL